MKTHQSAKNSKHPSEFFTNWGETTPRLAATALPHPTAIREVMNLHSDF